MIQEIRVRPISGWFVLSLVIILLSGLISTIVYGVNLPQPHVGPFIVVAVLAIILILLVIGFEPVQPNTARVLLLFGDYQGSIVESGFYWVNPFLTRKSVTLRIRNFETGAIMTPEKKDATGKIVQLKSRSVGRPSKVNDRDGNPIEISAVVVWQVVNTAEALFAVDDYEDYVAVQSEAALRNLASRYSYDSEDHELSLRGNSVDVCDHLRHDIQERLDQAGVKVIEARISHLAYAPEIAAAMLQRQQAQAIVAARTKIVEGAVGMVRMALQHLSDDKIVELDDERRAAMVSNLLVVLCSDRHAQPVVNTGTLYN